VDNISFEVKKGEVLGFLGPNGAGKSTTMKVITCYLPPTAGTVTIDGLHITRDSIQVRKRIGYLPEDTPLYQDMTVFDYLSFMAAMRNVAPVDVPRRLAYMSDVCGLETVLGKRIDALSKGFRQRVGLAQAMIHDPEIVILDEPTSGLDPNQIVEIRELIKAIGTEKTVILSTHILPEVQASCDRVLIIHRGQLVADGTPQDLQDSLMSAQKITFGVQDATPAGADTLSARPELRVVGQEIQGGGETLFTLTSDEKSDLRPVLFNLAVENGWALTELHRDQANLEDVFRQLTSN
jgi:ABC-2 type transport system ATP-binding protein